MGVESCNGRNRFLYVSVGSSTVQVADAYAHVTRLVSVIKMATVLEKLSTEKQSTVMPFFLGKRTRGVGYSRRNVPCLWWEVFVA
jgi:hypothetical protein